MLFQKNSLASSFKTHYRKALKACKKLDWIKNAKYELLPAMFVICDYAAASAGKDRQLVADIILKRIKLLYLRFNSKVFDQRTEIYGSVIRGMKSIRGEFAWGDTDGWDDNAIMKVAAVWGDIIVNPSCALDYDNAPWVIGDAFGKMDFCMKVMPAVLDEMIDLFKDIYRM